MADDEAAVNPLLNKGQPRTDGRDERGRFTKDVPNRFRPGVSGNPRGRPKSITLSDAYRKFLAQPMPGDRRGRTYAEAIAESLGQAAAGGDVAAAKEIADRVEGRPHQAVDLDVQVTDWRRYAARNGIDERDVITEARRIIQSADDERGPEPD